MYNPEIFPAAPEGGELIHIRKYEVRAYKMSNERFILRGAVSDEKPAGLYVSGDPNPLRMHHMIVDLEVAYPSFTITSVRVDFLEHPQPPCPDIAETYQQLVGISIARGFTNKVKELFGGPRGCTHVGALLAAMAPVAIQSGWSMRAENLLRTLTATGESVGEDRRSALAHNINTCHIWRENGPAALSLETGTGVPVPLSVKKRLVELGRSADDWAN